MTMPTRLVRHYIEPLLGPGLSVQNIRRDQDLDLCCRYVADPDARTFCASSNRWSREARHRFSHPKALSTGLAVRPSAG